jgi:uncharacterized metal-binding protein
MRLKALAMLAAAALAPASSGVSAAVLGPDTGAPMKDAARSRPMQAIHGCHYTCECGPLKDFGCEQVYHRHLHMLCLPVRCGGDTKCEPAPAQGLCRHITPP